MEVLCWERQEETRSYYPTQYPKKVAKRFWLVRDAVHKKREIKTLPKGINVMASSSLKVLSNIIAPLIKNHKCN